MRQLLVGTILSILFFNISYSQTATLTGTVKDSTGELLDHATVVQLPVNGTYTDEKGHYELKVPPGDLVVIVMYTGFNPDTLRVKVAPNETRQLDIMLGHNPSTELQEVVIGADKKEVKLQNVVQTVDIIKPRMLENNNISNTQDAVLKIPGVTVLDGQMAIRGGSGYAYGSGSRVILVQDEMPLMSADRGEIKWSFIPTENVEQMEIVKGASTVQYGSAALNGVLSVTTGYARDTPSTKVTMFYTGMGKPPVDSFQWWKRGGNFLDNPNTGGVSFVHKQKFGDFDFVFSGMLYGSQSHLQSEYDDYTRFNTKIRWQPHNLKRLTIELSSLLLYRKDGFQFYWQDGGHPYLAASGVTLNERYFYGLIEPKIKYLDKKGNQHKIYTRYFRQNNVDGQTDFNIYTVDYQFRHDFPKYFSILTGARNEHATVSDGTLGNHKTDFGGAFVMGEFTYKKFILKAGAREEYVRLDSAITPTIPVFSLGINQQVGKFNYLRASFGQSYRIPSIAERFVSYDLAGVQIIPNYDIKPEKGFTAELGYKRSINIGNWKGYLDAALFWTEFRNMIEFQFNAKVDYSSGAPQLVTYFQSQNVAHARIFGWELSAFGQGKWGPVDFSILAGYTYFYGVDLGDTSLPASSRTVGGFMGDAFKKFAIATPIDAATGKPSYDLYKQQTKGMLKYRNPHTFKADLDFVFYNNYHFGTSLQYYGYMTNIDAIFEVVIQGARDYRIAHLNKGDFVWDLRCGYQFNKNIALNFLVKNVLNSDYSFRIAKPGAPRNYTAQLIVNFGGRMKHSRDPESMVGNSNM